MSVRTVSIIAENFMTLKEAAAALGVPEVTIRVRLWRGLMLGYKVGRTWRIPTEEVARLLVCPPRVGRKPEWMR